MRRIAVILGLAWLMPFGMSAQTAHDSNKPKIEVSAGNGVTIASAEGNYSLTVKARMAGGVGLDFDEDGSLANTNFALQKARLNLSGCLVSKKLTYSLQFGFAPADTKALPNGNSSFVRDAVLHYKPNSHWQLSFGQTKVKANRAHMTSSQLLAFTGRSIDDGPFQQDRDFGLFAEFSHKLTGDVHVALKGSVTSGEGRDYGVTKQSGLSYNARLELYPLGQFEGGGAFSEIDLAHEQTPKLMLGGAFTYNDRAKRVGGQTGAHTADGLGHNLTQYYADLAFKYQGFALQADFMGRYTNQPCIAADNYIYKGIGCNAQASYNLPCRKWTMALRNSILIPHRDIRALVGYKRENQTTAALSYHLLDNRVKVQAEASYNHHSEPVKAYNRWQCGMVLEVGM